MMSFLIVDIMNHRAEVRMRNGKCSEIFLPRKRTPKPSRGIDMIGRTGFNFSNKIGNGLVRFEPDQDVRVVGHAIDCKKFLVSLPDNACDVFLQLFLAARPNYA